MLNTIIVDELHVGHLLYQSLPCLTHCQQQMVVHRIAITNYHLNYSPCFARIHYDVRPSSSILTCISHAIMVNTHVFHHDIDITLIPHWPYEPCCRSLLMDPHDQPPQAGFRHHSQRREWRRTARDRVILWHFFVSATRRDSCWNPTTIGMLQGTHREYMGIFFSI